METSPTIWSWWWWVLGVVFLFPFICLVKEDLEKCFQISLMLHDYFIETGVRLLLIIEKFPLFTNTRSSGPDRFFVNS